jgi:hypothetical protein
MFAHPPRLAVGRTLAEEDRGAAPSNASSPRAKAIGASTVVHGVKALESPVRLLHMANTSYSLLV